MECRKLELIDQAEAICCATTAPHPFSNVSVLTAASSGKNSASHIKAPEFSMTSSFRRRASSFFSLCA
jgi:hypothetical protein